MDIVTYALTKSPDYNKLKNRPFYEGIVDYKWDGNIEGRDSFTDKHGDTYIKISDDTPSLDMLQNFKICDYQGEYENGFNMHPGGDKTCSHDQIMGFVVVCYNTTINYIGSSINVPSTGIYYNKQYSDYYISGKTIKQIDAKFLPDLPDNIVTIGTSQYNSQGEFYNAVFDAINSGKNIYIRHNNCLCPLITIADSGTEYKLFFASAVVELATGENTKLAYWYIQAVKDSTDDIYIKEAK